MYLLTYLAQHRCAIFGHVASLCALTNETDQADHVSVNMAVHSQVNLLLGHFPSRDWRRWP